MKIISSYIFLLITASVYSQNQNAMTENGQKVILRSDKTWEYQSEKELKKKITLEFTAKDLKKQFQVVYDALDNNMVNSGSQVGGFYNSGWKKSMFVEKMENQITFKVANMGTGTETVTLNIYVDDKLVKTITDKAKSLMQGPATLTINLEDYK